MTKDLVHDIKYVPVPWIFEHYCKLEKKLNGDDVKIKSLFTKERTPSMCIYFDNSRQTYKYKDFSSGNGGSAIDLVKELKQTTYYKACQLVIEEFNDFVLHNNGGYNVQEFKVAASRYKVTSKVTRQWTTLDQVYWTQFNIGTKLLNEHLVVPLENYTMVKDDKELRIRGLYLYGYFKTDGSLYKIYQPKTLDKKFLKVSDYVQGSDQLHDHRFLVITSSLKDIMALKSLKLSVDYIAPDSENSTIKKELMNEYLKKYEKVIVLFDFDEPGIKAMERYKQLYPDVLTAVLPMSKDPADSIRDHGANEVRNRLVPILNKKLEN